MKMKSAVAILASLGLFAAVSANAEQAPEKLVVKVQQLDVEHGNKDVGTVEITEEKDGKLTAGLAAGGHWNPNNAKGHGFPWSDDAHLGDLPALTVLHDGSATQPVLAPRIKKLSEVQNHSIMIHVGGDNHSDHPAALGGGGPRMACGVIK